MATEAHCTGGLFSVALSVAETSPRLREQRRPSCEGWPSDHPACPPCKVYHLEAIACSADGTEKYTMTDER
jgi:hypothetical protein